MIIKKVLLNKSSGVKYINIPKDSNLEVGEQVGIVRLDLNKAKIE